MNHPSSYKFNNLVLISEDENTIRKNIIVGNVYTFLHADFESVEFYATRMCMNFTKEGIE